MHPHPIFTPLQQRTKNENANLVPRPPLLFPLRLAVLRSLLTLPSSASASPSSSSRPPSRCSSSRRRGLAPRASPQGRRRPPPPHPACELPTAHGAQRRRPAPPHCGARSRPASASQTGEQGRARRLGGGGGRRWLARRLGGGSGLGRAHRSPSDPAPRLLTGLPRRPAHVRGWSGSGRRRGSGASTT